MTHKGVWQLVRYTMDSFYLHFIIMHSVCGQWLHQGQIPETDRLMFNSILSIHQHTSVLRINAANHKSGLPWWPAPLRLIMVFPVLTAQWPVLWRALSTACSAQSHAPRCKREGRWNPLHRGYISPKAQRVSIKTAEQGSSAIKHS